MGNQWTSPSMALVLLARLTMMVRFDLEVRWIILGSQVLLTASAGPIQVVLINAERLDFDHKLDLSKLSEIADSWTKCQARRPEELSEPLTHVIYIYIVG